MDDDGHPRVLVSNRQSRELDEDALIELARETLEGEGLGACELSISFVEEAEMADLHDMYMGEPGPTDVLSFPMDGSDAAHGGPRIVGDVVIAPTVAAANNPKDPGGEIRLLLAHGILHLLGYDHENDADKAVMWARQHRYSGVMAS
jgi:probable rRNA maturation factor